MTSQIDLFCRHQPVWAASRPARGPRHIAVAGVKSVSTVSNKSGQPQHGENAGNPDRSPWVLLLLVPVVIPLVTGLYNSVHPVLLGMPAFYWLQLAFVPLSALCTAVVYLSTRKR